MQREYPSAPLVGVGAVIVDRGRVLVARRGHPPLEGHWTLPGGVLELGETLVEGVTREVKEETGLEVEPVELVELLERIHCRDGEWTDGERAGGRIQFHYVIADYLCRVTGGVLEASSDADAVQWIERSEWEKPSALELDSITVRVIEKGWRRARDLWSFAPEER